MDFACWMFACRGRGFCGGVLMHIALAIQIATMLYLGVWFIRADQVRLGIAQFLLAAVTGVLYSGRMA